MLIGAVAAIMCSLPAARAQLAPVVGTHYAARASETGFAGAVNSTGDYGASVPLDLPAVRGGLPLPFAVVYGGHQVGAAGLSWDVPLSYIVRSATIARRRPQPRAFTTTNPPPLDPPVELSVMLGGEPVELVRNAADTAWLGRRSGTQLEVRATDDATMVMYDGEGRTYVFSSQGRTAGSRLAGGSLYLLVAIAALGNTVQFTYAIDAPVVPGGGTALSINLSNVAYNQSPTSTTCFKNAIQLLYDAPSAGSPPLALSLLNGTVLARVNKLTAISVKSKASCADADQLLRDYAFNYQTDVDTRRPQLQSVTMRGRQGTPERNITLPVAAYTYGSIVDPATQRISYLLTTNAGPPLVAGAHHYSFGVSHTGGFPSPEPHGPDDALIDMFTQQAFIDLDGDNRPDFFSEVGLYRNVPGPHATTQFANRTGTGVDLREKIHSAILGARIYPRRNDERIVNDTLRQLIDMNGDGRLDVVETVLPDTEHWIIHLNTPDPADPSRTVFVDVNVPVKRMRQALGTTGLSAGRVPMARRTTVLENFAHCFVWTNISGPPRWAYAYPQSCPDIPLDSHRRRRTITEFELRDVNGDGYPDFVYNASFVRTADPMPPDFLPPPPADPTVFGQHTSVVAPGDMVGSRDVRVLINTAGVHLAEGGELFASPTTLEVGWLTGCGVARWQADPSSPSGGMINQTCGFEDVNGDGVADRVTSVVENGQVVARAALGTGVPARPYATDAVIALPGPIVRTETDLALPSADPVVAYLPRNCIPPTRVETFDLRRTRGLRDINGDGIPDYVAGVFAESGLGTWTVAMGTGAGFAPPTIVDSPLGLELSLERSVCSTPNDAGEIAATPTGLYDINGDGQPELVSLNLTVPGSPHWDILQLRAPADQYDVGLVAGVPASGRLTRIENGYGATTRIGYRSAKEDTASVHRLPYPEIVVTSVATTDASAAQLTSTVRHAYRGAGQIFDPGRDAFVFPGYQRRVELRATSEEIADGSVAVVTDTYGLAPFDPAMTIAARFQRYLQVGRVKDVTTLSGRLGTDPWAVAIGDITTSSFRTSGAHYDWDARLLTAGATPRPPSNELCIDMMFPYDHAASLAHRGQSWEDECTKRGFLFAKAVAAWRGDPGTAEPFGSQATVKTRSEVQAVDDLGRTTEIALLNDTVRSDDDQCVRTVYATPTGANERVLSAPASRTMTADACKAAAPVVRLSETYEYDTSSTGARLPAGKVAAGLLTARIVSRRSADTGAPIATGGSSDIRVFDATYDATGALASTRTVREDGATHTVTTTYDPFAIAAITVTTDATNPGGGAPPPLQFAIGRDPVTLEATSLTEPNGMQAGTTYDGFGRALRSSVAPPGGPAGVLSATSYLGFAQGDSSGRRLVTKQFTNPVAPSSVNGAAGRTSTLFLDALGRATRTEVALGADQGNAIVVAGRRSYDKLGRVKFEADAHPSTESAATAYGTSYFFNIDGTPSCAVRARGPHVYTAATDEVSETYPTCTSRYFTAHQERVDVADAASLLAGSPQRGIFHETIYTATGRALDRSTYVVDFDGISRRLEQAQFGYDALGHMTAMVRSDFAHAAFATTTWHYDTLDQVTSLDEPGVATQLRSYDRWGGLTSTSWCDPTISACPAGAINRRTDNRYDGLGRLVHSEDRSSGAVLPETVKDFVYDEGVNIGTPAVTATNVRGRLALATAATSSVSFSYDAFGRIAAQVFTDRTAVANNLYVQKHEYHGDGSLRALHFLLPDNAFRDERVDFTYDSAGRTRSVTYSDGASQSLFAASGSANIYDVFGRIRRAQYGATTYAATYADTGRRLPIDTTATLFAGQTRQVSFAPIAGTTGAITAFDPMGRERVRTESAFGSTQPAKLTSYDALGRLAAASVLFNGAVVPLRSFSYDSLGNILSQSDLSAPSRIGANAMTYQTVDRDRICSIGYATAAPPAACNVAYDGVGNVVAQPDRSGATRTFAYFPSGQVARIASGDTVATFDYDAFGEVQRLVLTSPTAADTRNDKHFGPLISQRDELVAGVKQPVIVRSIPGPGVVATRHGPGGSDPWTFSFGERRGTRFVTDRNGARTQELNYEPYGEALSSGAPPGSQHYQNQQWNDGDALGTLGLVQLGARIYDPVIGRFLSRDPAIIPRTATTSNPYAFAHNDPINRADPTGLDPEGQPTDTPPPCDPGVCGSSGPGGHTIHERPGEPSRPEHTSTTSSGSQPGRSLGIDPTTFYWLAIEGVIRTSVAVGTRLAEDGRNMRDPEVAGFTSINGDFILKPGIPEAGDPFWIMHTFSILAPLMIEASLFESGINYNVLAQTEAAEAMGIARATQSEAQLAIAFKPGFPSHNKIGLTLNGETQWAHLIASEEVAEFSANPAIQSSQLTFGTRPAWIQIDATISPRYQISTMNITRSQAAGAWAEIQAIKANPGTYNIVTNSCTTFCRSVMNAAGKKPAWWARSPGLLFKSVK